MKVINKINHLKQLQLTFIKSIQPHSYNHLYNLYKLNKLSYFSKTTPRKHNRKPSRSIENQESTVNLPIKNEENEEIIENIDFINQRLSLTKTEFNSIHDCKGCGIKLQHENNHELGYVPKEKYMKIQEKTRENKEIICERCFKLQTQGQFHKENQKKQSKPERILEEIQKLKEIKLNPTANPYDSISNTTQEKPHYYSSLDKINSDDLIKLISNRLSKYSQVFYIVDITEIESSLNVELLRMIESKQCGVTFIINKYDLLPEGNSYDRLNRYSGEEIGYFIRNNSLSQLKYSYIVVSSKTGHKMEYVLSKLKQMSLYYKEKRIYHGKPKIYIVGNCNIGKSTFINKLTESIYLSKRRKSLSKLRKKDEEKEKDNGNGKEEEKEKEKDKYEDDYDEDENQEMQEKQSKINVDNQIKHNDKSEISNLTSSSIPGTTLNIIKIQNMSYNCIFYDTPGFPPTNSFISKLYNEYEALLSITMTKKLKTNLINIKQNYSIFLGSLVRIDMINGEDKSISCFTSEGVTVHKTPTSKIDSIWDRTSGILLRPRVKWISQDDFICHKFDLDCEKHSKISHDIVISGLGWVSVTGKGFCQIEVWTIKGVDVYKRRKVLCPYEIRVNKVGKLYGKTLNIRTKRNKDVFEMYQKINNQKNI